MTRSSLLAGALMFAGATLPSLAGAQIQTRPLYHAATLRHVARAPFDTPALSLYLPSEEGAVEIDTRDARVRRELTVPRVFAPTVGVRREPTWVVNASREIFRMHRPSARTWVGLGLGAAGVGLSAVLFRLAGSQNFSLLPRQDGSARSNDLAAATAAQSNGTLFSILDNGVLSPISHYQLRYDSVGDLTLRMGLDSLSSSLFQLLLSPRDNALRYLRTSMTELRGGWMFSLQGSLW